MYCLCVSLHDACAPQFKLAMLIFSLFALCATNDRRDVLSLRAEDVNAVRHGYGGYLQE
jgi:hypothetical protein